MKKSFKLAVFIFIALLFIAQNNVFANNTIRHESYPFLSSTQEQKLQPNTNDFEYIGQMDLRLPPERRAIVDRTNTLIDEEILLQRIRQSASSKGDGSLGLLVSADGKIFVEKPHRLIRRENRPMPHHRNSIQSSLDEISLEQISSSQRTTGLTPLPTMPISIIPPIQKVIFKDERFPVLDNNDSFPWRARGVMVKAYGPKGLGSGSMIGPRHVLLTAHQISKDGKITSLRHLKAAPGGNKYTYPFDLREVEWYYWPAFWDGKNRDLDYGVLVLKDNARSPGYISFGYSSNGWLKKQPAEMVGYPSGNCKFSPYGENKSCGKYMYWEYKKSPINDVNNYTFHHSFSGIEGASGSPIYATINQVIYGIHTSGSKTKNTAKRLSKYSYQTICQWVLDKPSQYFINITC